MPAFSIDSILTDETDETIEPTMLNVNSSTYVKAVKNQIASARLQDDFIRKMYKIRERYLNRLTRYASYGDDNTVFGVKHLVYAIKRMNELYGYEFDQLAETGRTY